MVCRNEASNHACLCDLIESLLNRPTYMSWFAGHGVGPTELMAILGVCNGGNCCTPARGASSEVRLSQEAERLFAALRK